ISGGHRGRARDLRLAGQLAKPAARRRGRAHFLHEIPSVQRAAPRRGVLQHALARLRSSFCIFRIISRRCLRFISCQWCCVGWLVALLFCSSGLDFMLTFLCRIQLGSARLAKTTQSRQRGRAVLLFRTTPAAIYTIARTGAMLLIGQERSRENAALAAEPSCALDFSWATP